MKKVKKVIVAIVFAVLLIVSLPFVLCGAIWGLFKDALSYGETGIHRFVNRLISWAE